MISESDQVQIIQVKHDPGDCNHRITELYSHRNCSKNAVICEQNCNSQLPHDYPRYMHEKVTVHLFKKSFIALQQPCQKQTEHYIRQIHEVEKLAIENIRKKKAECLKEIEDLKKTLMSKTYSELEIKYPDLYEKFKSERFDTLHCSEVFWVVKTNKSYHPMKHSQINSKLQNILKKFQNFKDVSKNITPTLIFNKQKAKNTKIMEKIKEPVIKVIPNITIERPDYSTDKFTKISSEIMELSKKKKDIQNQYNYLQRQTSKLTEELNKSIYKKRLMKNRLKLQSCVYELKIENLSAPIENAIPPIQIKTNAFITQRNELIQPIFPEIPLNPPQSHHKLKDQMQQPPVEEQQLQQSKFNGQIEQNHHNSLIHPHENEHQQNQHNNNGQNDLQNKQSKQQMINIAHQVNQENKSESGVNEENQAQIEQEFSQDEQKNAQPRIPLQEREINEGQGQLNKQLPNNEQQQANQARKQQQKEPIIKQQFDDDGFEPWTNKELLDEMRKFGKESSGCLKVENIDILKSFATVHLNPPRMLINPLLRRTNYRGEVNSTKQAIFTLKAMQLVAQELKRNTQNHDKAP